MSIWKQYPQEKPDRPVYCYLLRYFNVTQSYRIELGYWDAENNTFTNDVGQIIQWCLESDLIKQALGEGDKLIADIEKLKLKREPCASALYDTYVVAGWNEAIEAVKKVINNQDKRR